MKNRDFFAENFSDVKNSTDDVFYPGQYVPMELSLFYPGGLVP